MCPSPPGDRRPPSSRSRRLPIHVGGGFSDYKPVTTPAVEFLADLIRKNPGEVTLIAVGPLQNIGDLVRMHPDVVPLVKRVVLMGGSVGRKCVQPVARRPNGT